MFFFCVANLPAVSKPPSFLIGDPQDLEVHAPRHHAVAQGLNHEVWQMELPRYTQRIHGTKGIFTYING